MALSNNRQNFSKIFAEFLRFGLVGVSAAAVHFSVVVFLVKARWLSPLTANVLAFLTAFQVSYWGNRRWTFSGKGPRHAVAFPRLLLVSSLAFIANEALFYGLMKQFHLPYPLALLIVLSLLPLAVFGANKWWVFNTIIHEEETHHA